MSYDAIMLVAMGFYLGAWAMWLCYAYNAIRNS
jgi:hypothetical protein